VPAGNSNAGERIADDPVWSALHFIRRTRKNFRQRVQWELSGIKNCGLRVGHGSGRLLWLPQCVKINRRQLPIVVYKERVMRIAIFGAGGLGGYFGARLARSKAEVIFIARGEHLDAIREKGLRVDSISGDFVVFPAQATDDPAKIGTVDVVILGVKAWQVNTVLPALRPLIGPETTIVPLQNGVEAPYQLVQAFGAKHVVGGLAKIISFKVGAGHIRHAGADPYIAIGELDKGPGERSQRIGKVFQKAGITVELPADIEVALWQKFLLVVSWGGVGAVTDAPIGVVRSLPETREMLERSMYEVLSVAQARNIALPNDAVVKTIAFVDSLPPNGTTSLHRDIISGYPSELAFWNGAVVRLGQEMGVPTPVNRFIYNSLLPRELRAQKKIVFPE
jgi:2-dehydropantoate 2-reductase